jgi:hypothetical protein
VQVKDCQQRIRAARRVNAGLAGQAGKYRRLNDESRSTLCSLMRTARVPDALFDASEQLCEEIRLKGAGEEDGPTGAEEVAWANHAVVGPLNQQVRIAARSNDWRLVEGIIEEGRPQGCCAADHWVVRYEESRFGIQSDEFGTSHPNRAGHELYALHMVRTITPDRPSVSGRARRCPTRGVVPGEVRSSATCGAVADHADGVMTRYRS